MQPGSIHLLPKGKQSQWVEGLEGLMQPAYLGSATCGT